MCSSWWWTSAKRKENTNGYFRQRNTKHYTWSWPRHGWWQIAQILCHIEVRKHQKAWKYITWYTIYFNPFSMLTLLQALTFVSPHLSISFHRVSQVTLDLGAVLVRLASHLQLVRISGRHISKNRNPNRRYLTSPALQHIPEVGFWSRHTTECLEGRWAAERRERRLRPPQGAAGQRACWWRWPPALPASGPTGRTPARHPRLYMNGKEEEKTHIYSCAQRHIITL